jgi:hypothetical protein
VTILEPVAHARCNTRAIGNTPKVAAGTPVTIIRVSRAKVFAAQKLQQKFRGCRVIPIGLASPVTRVRKATYVNLLRYTDYSSVIP